MTEKRSAIDSLVESSMLQSQSIRDLRDTIAQSNQQLSDRIEQVNSNLTSRIEDLAVQIGHQSQSIDRLERTLDSGFNRLEQAIDNLVQESRQNNETAKLQAQNVAELIKTVQQLALARG